MENIIITTEFIKLQDLLKFANMVKKLFYMHVVEMELYLKLLMVLLDVIKQF